MEIVKNYLINLKRSPERLYTWLGAQDQMDFDFGKLTIVEAVDGKDFESVRSIFDYAADLGFTAWRDLDASHVSPILGYIANTITYHSILYEIASANTPDTQYYLIWEDDWVLNIPWLSLNFTTVPPDAKVILPLFHKVVIAEKMDVYKNEPYSEWIFPYYKGCIGWGAQYCTTLNSAGAKFVFELMNERIGEGDGGLIYESLFMEHGEDIPGLYTFGHELFRGTQISKVFSLTLDLQDEITGDYEKMVIADGGFSDVIST